MEISAGNYPCTDILLVRTRASFEVTVSIDFSSKKSVDNAEIKCKKAVCENKPGKIPMNMNMNTSADKDMDRFTNLAMNVNMYIEGEMDIQHKIDSASSL
jgi:hypothetical protein